MNSTTPILRRLHFPEDEVALRQVWDWIQARPRLYTALGGAYEWEEFKLRAMRPVQADFGCWLNGELQTDVSVKAQAPGEFALHVMSRPKVEPQLVARTVYQVGRMLFAALDAQRLRAYVPGFHHGSRRIAEACGMRLVEQEALAPRLRLNVFEMDRAEYLRNHQHGQWS